MMVWQFAQRIWHLRISVLIRRRELPAKTISDTFFRLLSRWSNWSTRWSVVPQSVHLPYRRLYRSTKDLLRCLCCWFWTTRVSGDFLYHFAELAAQQLLQLACSPSFLDLFFEKLVSGWVVPQAPHRFMGYQGSCQRPRIGAMSRKRKRKSLSIVRPDCAVTCGRIFGALPLFSRGDA
jgi:hypothetical protein